MPAIVTWAIAAYGGILLPQLGLTGKEILMHAVLLGVPASIVGKFYKKDVLFTYHPSAMGVAYLAVMGEGILLAKAATGKAGQAKLLMHLWCQAAASALALAGFWAIYKNKVNNGAKHFTSSHGKLGAVTVFGTVGVSVGGLLGFYGPKLLPSSLWGSVAAIKTVHRVSARFVYGAALLCIYLGIAPANQAKPWNTPREPTSRAPFLTQASWGWVAGILLGGYMVISAPSARAALAARMAKMAAMA